MFRSESHHSPHPFPFREDEGAPSPISPLPFDVVQQPATMTANPNPNTNSIAPMEPRSRALTLVIAFVLAVHSPLPALSSAVRSPSLPPSPSPAPLLPPPKQLMADPAGRRRPSPPAKSLHFPPPHPGLTCPGCHHFHNPGATAVPPHREWKLNFGQLMGITLAAVALALQVALGGFLVYKRVQLRKVEMQYRQRLGPSSSASSS